MKLALVLLLAVPLFAADEAKEAVSIPLGIVLPQIAAGGAWSTDIQVMHAGTQNIPIGFNLRFYGDDGNPLALPVEGLGMASIVAGAVQARGQRIIRLSGGDATLAGYALIEAAPQTVAISAVLTQKVDGRPDFQASITGQTGLSKDLQFPFRNDGPYTTTLAVVGVFDQDVTAIARDDEGIELCRDEYFASGPGHGANLLTALLPCADGRTGTVQILSDTGFALIAFLFNDSGAFTTQIPYEITGR